MPTPLPQRVPENAPGDFYVQADLCTQCCLPHGEAPDLLNDPKQFFKECYFRRQPQTPEEVDRAIDAISVSEMCALRYAGDDPAILDKLRARNLAAQCDQTSEGRAWLDRPASRPAAPSTPLTPAPLSYRTPPSEPPATPPLVRGMRRARTITGWLAFVTGLFAGFNSADRNPLQWPAMFVFMPALLLYIWALLINWFVDFYLVWSSHRRPR